MARPEIIAAKAGVQAVRQQRRTEVQSVSGASQMLQSTLSKAIRDLKHSGLSGQDLHFAAQELASRKVDAAQAVPLLKADARASFASQLTSAQGAVQSAKVGRAQDFQQTLASLLEKARTQSRSAMVKSASDHQSAKGDSQAHGKAVKAAMIEARRLLEAYPKHPPEDSWEWARFQKLLDSAEGVSPAAARSAVKILRANQRKILAIGQQSAAAGIHP
jgi:hypothetical protein